MMRGQRHFAVACRRPDGEIILRQEAVPAFFTRYRWAIGRMKEVKRLFRYHGAEHKAINGLEQEGVADVDVAMRQSRIHPRCGTNFVLTVLLIKVGVFALFGWPSVWVRLGLRIA